MTDNAWCHDKIERQLLSWLERQHRGRPSPIFIGLDGRSGSGKSTLAAAVAEQRGDTSVIQGDQFYAGGSAAAWDQRSKEDRAALVIDWRRQRAVLDELRTTGSAAWRSFDWHADDWDSETVPLVSEPTQCGVRPVVLLEGAYSCRPELHDLLDGVVLLEPPSEVRRAQLLAREGDVYRTEWEARWSEAEDFYFGSVMPRRRFDLVLDAS